jgi:hypothetical protein
MNRCKKTARLRNLRDVIVTDELEKVRKPDTVRDSFIIPWLPSEGELRTAQEVASKELLVARGPLKRWR